MLMLEIKKDVELSKEPTQKREKEVARGEA